MNFRHTATFQLTLLGALLAVGLSGCATSPTASAVDASTSSADVVSTAPAAPAAPAASTEPASPVVPVVASIGPERPSTSSPSEAAADKKPLSETEKLVKERAHARWQNLLKHEIDATYQLAAPSYRAVTSLDKYRATFGSAVRWLAADVFSVSCSEDRCKVVVVVKASPSAIPRLLSRPPIATAVDEVWLKEDGQWWYENEK